MLTNLDTILYPLIITKVHQVYPGLACISAIAIDTSVINQTRRGMVDNPCEHSWMSYLGNATDKTDKIIEDHPVYQKTWGDRAGSETRLSGIISVSLEVPS